MILRLRAPRAMEAEVKRARVSCIHMRPTRRTEGAQRVEQRLLEFEARSYGDRQPGHKVCFPTS
jgi:hypothetical protein